MRKMVLRIGSRPIRLESSGRVLDIHLSHFNAKPDEILWQVHAQDANGFSDLITAKHGQEVDLYPAWPDSWIALATPVTLHNGNPYRPEFVVHVPADTRIL